MRKLLIMAILCWPSFSSAEVSTPTSVDVVSAAAPVADLATEEAARFTLQVATVAERSDADRLAGGIPDTWVQEIRKNGAPLFRVNYKRFAERAAAVRAQWDLEDLGFESFIQALER